MLSFQDVVRLVDGKILYQSPVTYTIQHLLTDSRQLSSPHSTLFFAIQGEHHNGHRYIEDLYRQGVRQFVVEEKACTPAFINTLKQLQEACVVRVVSSILALQAIAAAHRAQFRIPVI